MSLQKLAHVVPIRLSDETFASLDGAAKLHNVPMNWLIRNAIDIYLRGQGVRNVPSQKDKNPPHARRRRK